jgi:hypothetical protein
MVGMVLDTVTDLVTDMAVALMDTAVSTDTAIASITDAAIDLAASIPLFNRRGWHGVSDVRLLYAESHRSG